MKAKLMGSFLMCILVIAVSMSAYGKEKRPYSIRVGTAGTGTGSYKWCLALNEISKKYTPEITFKLIPTRGGSQNIQMLKAGEIDMGVSFAYLDGKPADWWKEIGFLYAHMPIYTLVIVKKGSDIKTWKDLRGKRLCPASKGGSGAVYWERVLTGLGWKAGKDFKLRYASYGDTPSRLREGTVDALTLAGGINTPYAMELFTTMDVRLIDMPKDKMEAIHAKWYPPNSYPSITIKAGRLKGVDRDYKTWVSSYSHVIKMYVPEDVVYRFVKAFWDHQDEAAKIYPPIGEIKPEEQAGPFPIPHHPGALKYFKERGWIK